MMIDIDHFKRVNDTYGHAAGDAVIVEIARLLSGSLRASDRIARFGGEEFVILLRNVDETVVRAWAERARQKIEQAPVAWQGEVLRVTVSIGTTVLAPEESKNRDIFKLSTG
jgi:diguanylate cyclase (GGDEF)-like protein